VLAFALQPTAPQTPAPTAPVTPTPTSGDADAVAQEAAFDSGYGAPRCANVGSSCDSLALLNGRGIITNGNEPNHSNTNKNGAVCNDGNSGTYQYDESIEQITVTAGDIISGTPVPSGDFIVEGNSVNIEVGTLKVEDKNIELAALNDSSIGNDTIVNGAGIIINSEDGNKTLTWELAENAWTFNQNIDLSSSLSTYKINGSVKLSSTGSTTGVLSNISSAPQLTSVGTLLDLNVANLTFENNTIRSNGTLSINATGIGGINITAGGPISVQDNQEMLGLATPISSRVANIPGNEALTESADSTVATKGYVDSEVLATPITFSMDVTGLGSGSALQSAVADFINDMYPATVDNTGKVARIHATSYAGATVSGINVTVRDDSEPDSGEVLTLSKVFVDKITAESQSVVRDVAVSNTASGTAVLTPARQLLVFASNGTGWVYDAIASVVYP